MIKKIISILCIISVVFSSFCLSNVFAADAVLIPVTESNTYKVGDTFDVEIELADNPGFGALQFDIVYDTNVLKYVTHTMGEVQGNWADLAVHDDKLVVGVLSFMDNDHTNGNIVTVTFEAIANGSSDIILDNLDFVAISDEAELGQVPLNISSQSIKINIGEDTSSTTESTTVTTTENTTQVTTERATETTTEITQATTETVTQTTTEDDTETTTDAVTQVTTESDTETTTERITQTVTEGDTETTTRRHTSGGGSGAGASSITVKGYTATTTTEAATEETTDDSDSEPTTEATTEETIDTISNDVKVTIGSRTVVIGDESYEMDAAPYIQSASNSTLVPLRFVVLAIAGDDVENADGSESIVWDAVTKTAKITFEGKTIEFSAGSDVMVIDGVSQVMDNGVKAEITEGRMFVPFRALGEALGVDVEWNSDTKTAIYTA